MTRTARTASGGRRVWYASYGSNMRMARFGCYLAGGRPAGAAVTYPGCRDPRPPAASVLIRLSGTLYFATESDVWTGGRAFYDPDALRGPGPDEHHPDHRPDSGPDPGLDSVPGPGVPGPGVPGLGVPGPGVPGPGVSGLGRDSGIGPGPRPGPGLRPGIGPGPRFGLDPGPGGPGTGSAGQVLARAHLITVEQFSDVVAQEMGRAPGTGPAADLDLTEVLATGRARLGAGRYETLVHPGDRGGVPVLTFTAPWGVRDVAANPPSAAYLAHLAGGLVEAGAGDAQAVARYLARWPGAAGHWRAAEIAALVPRRLS